MFNQFLLENVLIYPYIFKCFRAPGMNGDFELTLNSVKLAPLV